MRLITTPDELAEVCQGYIEVGRPVCLDTETTGLSFLDDRLITVQMMQFGSEPIIVDVRQWSQKNFRSMSNVLQNVFDAVPCVGMNLLFDWKFIYQAFHARMHRTVDVMLMEQVIYGLGKTGGRTAGIAFDLKSIASRYGIEMSKEERNVFIGMDKRDEWYEPFSQETLDYMALDVAALEPIYRAQLAKLAEKRLTKVAKIENRCLPSVASIEYSGIHIDENGWRGFIQTKADEAERLGIEAIEVIGQAVATAKAKRFRSAMKPYQKYVKLRDAEIDRLKSEWEGLGKPGRWTSYQKEGMEHFHKTTPKLDRPKLESASPYAGWLIERQRFEAKLKHQYEAEERELSLEEYKQGMLYDWLSRNPEPEEENKGSLYHLQLTKQLTYSPINMGSSQQVLMAFEELGIPLTSTSADALASLPDGFHPAIDLLKSWRSAQMFPQKFGDNLLKNIHPKTRRIHPSYIIIGADTGRMSCTNPPWQQVPSKGDGHTLRTLVRAQGDNVLLTADFSNIELRILADLSRDKNMLKAFSDGVDLHSYTARMMFNLGPEVDVKHECVPGTLVTYRSVAKTINFGLVYGMSASKLARTLKIAKDAAKELMDKYFKLYPGVVRWLEQQKRNGVRTLESRTACGRVRYYQLPDRNDPDYNRVKASVERKACNSPIQGTSADITKLAMANFYEYCREAGLLDTVNLVAVVHDELVVESPKPLAEEVGKILGRAMDDACAAVLKVVVVPPTVISINEAWEKI